MEENEGFNLIDVSSENDSLIASIADDVSSATLPPQSSGDSGANGVDGTDLSNGLGEQLQQPFEAAEPESLKKTGKYNLRKSLAWDSAFLESPGDLGADGLNVTDLSNGIGEHLQQPFETAEPESLKKNGKYNLRKSLAWDSAFFESPGFLDAEDISTMIDGAEKGKQHFLPGIDEDISRSTESVSTLLSENLTLKSLEDDLFKDIRASIQKSSKASGISNSNRKAAAAKETDKPAKETDRPLSSSAKKVDVTSGNKIATNRTSMMKTGGIQGSGRILKKDSSFPLATQPDLRNGNPASSPSQPPKVIPKPGTMATPTITMKRASLGVNRTRIETSNSKVEIKGIQVPKAAGLTGPRRSVPKPASVSEASSSVASGASIKEAGSFPSSSNNGCNSTFIKKVHKFPSTSLRTKTEVKPVTKASSSIPKASPKFPLRKKPTGKSGPPSSLMSSKIFSSISPSSSVSSASSSTSTANRRHTSRTSINTNTLCSTDNERLSTRTSFDTNNSRRSMDSDNTPSVLSSDVQSNGDMSDGNMNQFKEPVIPQDAKRTSGQSSVLSQSAWTKPSGLRMPSPKIGFFDGAKSVVRTPSGCSQSQSRLPTGLPKIGAAIRSPDGSLRKAEKNNPLNKKAAADSNTVLDTLKSASPKLSQEPSRASMNVHSAHRSALSPCISSEVRSSNKATGRQQPEMASTNIQLEGLNFASLKPSQECVPDVSLEVHNEMDGSNCPKTEDVKFGKPDSTEHATANAPEAENDENLLLNV